MQHVGVNEAKVTVLKFGRQSSDLLAYGCQDGSVQVVNLEEAGDTDHVSKAMLCQDLAWLRLSRRLQQAD